MKKSILVLFVTVFTFLNQKVLASGGVLSQVKTTFATCKVDAFYKVRSAIADADDKTKKECVQFFIRRLEVRSQCDSYLALLGLQLLPDFGEPAVQPLVTAAITSSKEADLLNGPHPRLETLLSTLAVVTKASEGASRQFVKILAAHEPNEEAFTLAQGLGAFSPLDSENQGLQPLWRLGMSMGDEKIKTSKFKHELEEARIYLAQGTNAVFMQAPPVKDIVAAVNASGDVRFRTTLLNTTKNWTDSQDIARLKEVKDEPLTAPEKALLYNTNPEYFAKKIASLSKTLKLSQSESCKVGGQTLTLEQKVDSNDPEETMIWLKGKNLAVPALGSWNIQDIPLDLLSPRASQTSVCKKTLAFQVGDDFVLPVLGDDRPFGKNLSFAIFDANKLKLREVVSTPNQFADDETVQQDGNDLWFFSRAQPSDSAEVTEVMIGARKADVVLDGVLTVAHRLYKKGAHWALSNDVQKTWQKFPYQNFFKSQADFARAFGLDADPIVWVRVAMKDKQAFCIYPSSTRELPATETGWICL